MERLTAWGKWASHSAQIIPADTGFLAQLLPNRGRVTFLRGLIRIFLAVGVLAGLSLIWDVYRDLHARHTWPVADGEVVSGSQKDSKGLPGATTTEKHPRYWVEYEVRFAVPADQCKTGTVSADEQGSMPAGESSVPVARVLRMRFT